MSLATMIDAVIAREGGYSDHPADKGGPTNFGITEKVARQEGYKGDMRALPRAVAVAIYKKTYAERPGFLKVEAISPKIAAELFDTGVNMGPATATRFLQEWLNVLNNGGALYPDISEDGAIGPQTLAALKSYLATRGGAAEAVLLTALNCSQGERYKNLARARPANEAFVFGWLKNRVLA